MYFRNSNGISPNTFHEDTSYEEPLDLSNDTQEIDESFDDMSSGIIDEDLMLEAAIVQEVEMMHDDERKAYLESDEFQSLVEAGIVGRKTVVRLNRSDDMNRRIHLLCLQMGKEKGDSDWEQLRKNRINERKLLNKLYNKYSNQVRRNAVVSQKRLIKLSPKAFDMNKPIR
jgi:hypothetical protein